MNNKERLLDLISKKEEMCSVPLNHDEVYLWLEELHYLFGLIESPHDLVSKIMDTIGDLLYQELPTEKIIQLKAKLYVFQKYEVEKLKLN